MTTSMSAVSDLEDWYERYAPRIRRATGRIVGNADDAEDATQDAFLAAFRFYARYRSGDDPYPWLLRIAQRKALTIATSRRLTFLDDIPEASAVPVPSAEDVAVAYDESRRVAALVARDVPVALHLIDGLRFRDVSERLGIPPATAATRIRRGKHRLRAALAATTLYEPRSKSA